MSFSAICGEFGKIIVAVLPSVCTIIVALISSFMVIRAGRKDRKRSEIEKTRSVLHDFYYPYVFLLKRNDIIYQAFSKSYKEKDPNFRTLIYLLKGYKFEGNDKILLEKIIENTIQLNKLITEQSGFIDNGQLLLCLSKMSAHYTMLELAYCGKISSNNEKYFDEYVHPNEIFDMIDQEINKLNKRIQTLDN